MVFNNRKLCLLALSIEILVEHGQTISYLSDAPDSSVTWNSSATDAFKGLKDLSLRFYDSTFIGLYITAAIIVFVTLFGYLALNEKLHALNRKQAPSASLIIWFFEHILFGLCYVPILSQFVAVQYCDNNNNILSYSSVACWGDSHMTLLEIGYIFAGFTFFIVGVIAPVFKSERPKGIERKFGNESYFIGLYKFLIMSVIFLFGPIHVPGLGLAATAALIAYLLIYEAFSEIHVASMYMAVLFGQLWIFICATALVNDSSASDMLGAWPAFLVFGYGILPIKSLIIHRIPREIPIEKQ